MNKNDNSISIWISILYRYRRSFVNKKLDKYGIVGGVYLIILVLYKSNGSSQEQISDILKVDKTTVARAIKKLETEDYVKRETDTEDKRAYKVYLTPKALAVVPEIQNAINEWEKLIVADIPEESYHIMKQLLKQMAENACDIYSSNIKID